MIGFPDSDYANYARSLSIPGDSADPLHHCSSAVRFDFRIPPIAAMTRDSGD
jgi:hypothetical protein